MHRALISLLCAGELVLSTMEIIYLIDNYIPSLEGYSIDFGTRQISDAEAKIQQLRSFHHVHGAFC